MNTGLMRQWLLEGKCPYCGTKVEQYEEIEMDGDLAVREAACFECDKQWAQIYGLILIYDTGLGCYFDVSPDANQETR